MARQADKGGSLHRWRSALLRLQEGNAAMEKARLATALFGAHLHFPLASEPVTHVIMRLAPELRFVGGLRPSTKILFRHLLEDQPEDHYTLRSKASFRWDVRSFVDANRKALVDDVRTGEPILSGVTSLFADLSGHRCDEVRARKSYLIWLMSLWVGHRFRRGDAHGVATELPTVAFS
jgi:hypothetical protein